MATIEEPAGAGEAVPTNLSQPDPTRQYLARRYARARHLLLLARLAIAAVCIGVLIFAGFAIQLRNALTVLGQWQPLGDWTPLLVGVYFLVLIIAYELIGFPLAVYGGLILPRRYGLSIQTMRGWLADYLKGLCLGLVLELAAVEYIYLLLATQPRIWWLWVGSAMLLFSVVMTNLAPILLLPLFYRLTPLEDADLRARLLALAERAHTRVRGVFTMNMSSKSTTANAALMGVGNTRRIVVADTLLDCYTPDEIEVVLAHELGHHVHQDIWKLIVIQTALTLGGLYVADIGLHWAIVMGPYRRLTDVAAMPVLALVLGLFGLIMLPLSNGLSRLIERQADQYALEMTGKVEAFKSAMNRLANQNLAELDPSPLVEFFLYDHPAIGRRIHHAAAFAREQKKSHELEIS
jgi:STE24 endopeptidase